MDLKTLSLQDLEQAISTSIQELLDEHYTVTIEKLEFDDAGSKSANITFRFLHQKYKPGEFSD